MPELSSVRVIVRGRVQGVFFRDFTCRKASQLGLLGYVRNLPDGTVEVVAEGERQKLDSLLELLKQGPVGASVTKVTTHWEDYSGSYTQFSVSY